MVSAGTDSTCDVTLQAVFDSLGHKNVLVNGRLEQGPVQLKDGDLIEVSCSSRHPFVYQIWLRDGDLLHNLLLP